VAHIEVEGSAEITRQHETPEAMAEAAPVDQEPGAPGGPDESIERTGRRRRPRGEFRAEIGTLYGPVVEDPAAARDDDDWAVIKAKPVEDTDEVKVPDLTTDATEERSRSVSVPRRHRGDRALRWGTVALWVAGAVIVAVALFL
jgi:hypothetical protein